METGENSFLNQVPDRLDTLKYHKDPKIQERASELLGPEKIDLSQPRQGDNTSFLPNTDGWGFLLQNGFGETVLLKKPEKFSEPVLHDQIYPNVEQGKPVIITGNLRDKTTGSTTPIYEDTHPFQFTFSPTGKPQDTVKVSLQHNGTLIGAPVNKLLDTTRNTLLKEFPGLTTIRGGTDTEKILQYRTYAR